MIANMVLQVNHCGKIVKQDINNEFLWEIKINKTQLKENA